MIDCRGVENGVILYPTHGKLFLRENLSNGPMFFANCLTVFQPTIDKWKSTL